MTTTRTTTSLATPINFPLPSGSLNGFQYLVEIRFPSQGESAAWRPCDDKTLVQAMTGHAFGAFPGTRFVCGGEALRSFIEQAIRTHTDLIGQRRADSMGVAHRTIPLTAMADFRVTTKREEMLAAA